MLVLCSPSAASLAHAADPACVVLTDAAGDTFPAGSTGPYDPALDLQRVVFSFDGAALHIHVTLAAGGKPGSRDWGVNFDDGERYFSVHALDELDGQGFFAYGPGNQSTGPSRGRIEGRIDVATGIIDMTVRLAQLDLTPRSRFYGFMAEASLSLGNTGNDIPVPAWNSLTPVPTDQASGTRSYSLNRGCPATY